MSIEVALGSAALLLRRRGTFDAGEYGFDQPEVHATEILPQRRGGTFTTPPAVNRQVTFAPRAARAWEVAEP